MHLQLSVTTSCYSNIYHFEVLVRIFINDNNIAEDFITTTHEEMLFDNNRSPSPRNK